MVAASVKRAPASDSLGARVRAARRERGLSQAQLAGAELTKGFISQLESGLVRPSIRSLQVIANRLGRSLDYFIGDEALSTQKRAEFMELAAQAAYERRAWDELERVGEEALRLELDTPQRGSFLRWQAMARLGRGDREGAFSSAEAALRVLDPASDAGNVSWTLLVQGSAYLDLGQIAAAAQLYERALALLDTHEVLDARLRTRLLISVGTAYRRLNRTTKAVQAYESARTMANRISDLRSLAQAFMGVAVTLYDSGELDGAIANYRRALTLFQRIADQDFELNVLQSLAAVRFEQGNVDEAQEFARQCRERALAVGDDHWAAVADVELARIALSRGDAARALEIARRAESSLARSGDIKQRSSAFRAIGAAHHALGQHPLADDSYQRAIDLALSVEVYPDASQIAAEYAKVLRERGDYERAFEYLELARRHAGPGAPAVS